MEVDTMPVSVSPLPHTSLVAGPCNRTTITMGERTFCDQQLQVQQLCGLQKYRSLWREAQPWWSRIQQVDVMHKTH